MKIRVAIWTFLLIASVTGFSQAPNHTDEKGQKQGLWSKAYSNGQERYTGQFKDDKPVGTFFYYYDNGVKSSIVEYLGDDGVEANVKFFHTNGTLMAEGRFRNQLKEGEWKFYDNKAILSAIETYHEGKLHGTSKVYFLNGALAAETPYVNGLRTGPFKEYFMNGKVRMEGTYLDNTYDGEYKQYYEDGILMMKGQYFAAVRHGPWVYYDQNGKIKAQQVYENGVKVKEKIEPGYSAEDIPVELPEDQIMSEDDLMEQYFNEMQGGGR